MIERGCLLPPSVARQVAGTLPEQLAHLKCEVAKSTAAAAVLGDGFKGGDRKVIATLRAKGKRLRPREIQDEAHMDKTGVHESLNRLEKRGMVRRYPVESRTKTPAFEWGLV